MRFTAKINFDVQCTRNVQGREKSGRTDQRESRQREILAKWTRESLAKEEFWQNGPERVKPKRNYDTVDLRDSSQKKILGAGLGQREWVTSWT